MTFFELVEQVSELLKRHGRVTYRALQRQFGLDDDYLEDLKSELIEARQLAIDEQGRLLVWTGVQTTSPASVTAVVVPQRVSLAYTPPHLTAKILASRGTLQGERKQVTILFADIKGSTELIEGLDPEEARRLLDPALHVMMDAVHRYEGTVSNVLGDGIMALFGAPLAHEDHAIRACYAALVMQTAMRDYAEKLRRSHGIEMQIRVGLNSGEVVVRTISNDLHMDYSAVGQSTHLAARMEQLAPPGSIRLTATTLRLVEGLVRVNALGAFPVKGLTEPVEVFELIGASTIRGRLQAAATRGLTRFVGRQAEIERLNQTLEYAQRGQGQVVATVGEPGVGKSRLLYEFVRSHRTRGWLVLESVSMSYGKATAYFPVIDLLKRYVHIEEGDPPRTIRARVTGHILTLDETLQDTIPALLSLLDALPEDSPFLQLEAAQRRQRTLAALTRVLLRESQVQPVILVFEDAHWIDFETQALLDQLVESLAAAPLLLLVNYRPEYQHAWDSKPFYTQLWLDPLPPASAEELLQALLGDGADLQALKQLLIARTEGNPFFLEECVRTLVETHALLGEIGQYRLAQALPTVQVPATVQAVLAARIDRLTPEEKYLLQTAAVVGTEVPLPLLSAIVELPVDALHGSLAHLQHAEFLYDMPLFPERAYAFKHALTHDVAYNSLLQEQRQVLHARIVATLEALYPERLSDQVDRLAYHALRGSLWEKAVTYFRQAGERAIERSAYREAVLQFEQALTALQQLPEHRETCEQAMDVRFDLRGALLPLREFDRMLTHLREAERLARLLEDTIRLGRISSYMARYLFLMGRRDQAMEAGQQALTLATERGDFALQVASNMYLGQIYHAMGAYHRAIDILRPNMAALEGAQLQERFWQVNLPSVTSCTYLAFCLAELGVFHEAMAYAEEGLQIAEAVEHPNSLAIACMGLGQVTLIQGVLPTALSVLERFVRLCQSAQIPLLFPSAAAALSYAYALTGRAAEARRLLEPLRQTTVLPTPLSSRVVLWLGEAWLHLQGWEEAFPLAQHALELAQERQERGNQTWTLRLLGALYAQRPSPNLAQAETCYQEALALATALGMQPLQAHCQRDLGLLWSQMGHIERARTALVAAGDLYRALVMPLWLPQVETALLQLPCAAHERQR
jgi:class 3 adenylate cyclase/tetratricopeptide (TPR) repeat protein